MKKIEHYIKFTETESTETHFILKNEENEKIRQTTAEL